MSTVLQGIFRAANQDVPGATAYLFPASGFVGVPQTGDTIPSTGYLATAVTDRNGFYTFTDQPIGDYWVAITFDGLTVFQFQSIVSTTAASFSTLSGITLSSPTSGQVLTFSTSGTWTNQTPSKRSVVMTLMEGFTPLASGADAAQIVVPFSPADGTTVLTWTVRRIDWRVSGVGTTSGSITVQKSTAAGAFSATTVGTVTIGAATHEANNTTSLGTVASGDKIRTFINTLGDKTGWFVAVLCESQ
jgi:hypothetical protein